MSLIPILVVTTEVLTASTESVTESSISGDVLDLVAPLAGGIIAAIFVIAVILVVVIVCLFLTNHKRKKIVKDIQMEILTQ